MMLGSVLQFPLAMAPGDAGVVSGMVQWLAGMWVVFVPIVGLAVLSYRAIGRLEKNEDGLAKSRLYLGILVAICAVMAVALIVPTYNSPYFQYTDIGLVILFVAVVGLVMGVPRVRDKVGHCIARINTMPERWQLWTSLLMIVFSIAYFPLTAMWLGRSLEPVIHDELSYAVMARIFASGHLWMPTHPVGEAFESFYIFTKPVYGSMYFPGAGFLYAIPLVVGLPVWVATVTTIGVFLAALFRVLAKVFSPSVGLASFIGLLGVGHFRWFATHMLSHVPLAATVTLAYWFYLRWAETNRWRWLTLFAVCGGYATITRPYDAILVLLPPTAAMLWTMSRRGMRTLAIGVAICVACAAPFVALQLVIDKAYTGSALKTPFAAYFDRDMPNAGFGFIAPHPDVRPQTRLPQKIDFYDTFAVPQMTSHTVEAAQGVNFAFTRVLTYFFTGFGKPFAIVLFPLGLIAVLRTRYWALAVAAPLFMLGYVPYPYFLIWYNTSTIVCLLVCFWAGLRPLAMLFNCAREPLEHGVIVATALCGIVAQPFWFPQVSDTRVFESPDLAEIDRVIGERVKKPAIIFFFYQRNLDYLSQHEPVYNWQTAWPDDADIIRVQSVSFDQDLRTLHYFQKQNGSRNVYVYDRRNKTLLYSGTIDSFLQNVKSPAATQPH